MYTVYLATVVGILAGTFTGLIPGIHVNLVAALLVAGASALHPYMNTVVMCCFIIAMSVTHTFLDVIPSVFLGAPDPDTCLSVLPGHRFLLDGDGYTAVQLTVIGSLAALLLSALLFPLFLLLSYLYPVIRGWLAYILIAVVSVLIYSESERVWAVFVFLLTGVLGYAVLNHPGLERPLFPLLTGLFGMSTLGYSLRTMAAIPPQQPSRNIAVAKEEVVWAVGLGQWSGFLTAMLPGIGASSAAMLAVALRDLGRRAFMVLLGSVNTVNFVLSLAAFYAVEKARNGSVVAVQQLLTDVSAWHILLFLSAGCVAGGSATWATLVIARRAATVFRKIDYTRLVTVVVTGLVVLCLFLSGIRGLVVLVVSTATGLLPVLLNVKRVHAMGCLILPVIVYFA